jgi:Lhr-like helicase
VVEGLREDEISFEVKNSDIPSPFSHNLLLQESSDVIKMEDKKERLQELHQQVMDRIDGDGTT